MSFFHSLSWVAFEEPGFCGECYLLEKGLYGSPEDWGALLPRVASAMPVVLVRAMTHTNEILMFFPPGCPVIVIILYIICVLSLQQLASLKHNRF